MIEGQYDVVIAAVGAEPVVPKILGADGLNVTVATEAIIHSEKIGQNVEEITANHVIYTDAQGEHCLLADSVVLSVGMRAKRNEALSFFGTGKNFYLVGDCKKPGTVQTTNRNVYAICMAI